MESLAYLARQPILDGNRRIFAYELLFRDSPTSDSAVIASDVLATAQVLENVLNNIGLPKLIGNHKAFVNCSREMLLGDMFGLLNPKCFVLEILEDVKVDATLVKAVKRYKARGFELALDDFIFNKEFISRFEPLFPYVSYVKMDVVDNSEANLAKAATFFKEKDIKLLAEKVEDAKCFKKRIAEGYELFQGFFFAKPEIVTGKKIDSTSAAILKMLLLLRKHPTLAQLCKSLKDCPELSENLLRFVNSDAQYKQQNISEVKDAIAWIGMRNIQEWLMLMLYARPEMGVAPQSSPLFQNASHRAKFLELLARVVYGPDEDMPARAFTVGLISRMDALVGAPLDSILKDSSADDEMCEALLAGSGRLGLLLRLADAVEQDRQSVIRDLLQKLNLNVNLLNRCVNDAYSWTHER
ncbi:MAG: EAL domain-containing protein [Fibrobacter sp.]|nr:EAL domain-containing protein [Fibrobacter sp.]